MSESARRRWLPLAAAGLAVVLAGGVLAVWDRPWEWLYADESRYAGSAACQSCHATEFDGWQDSHHRQAMQPATPETVRGDFSGVTFTYAGATSTFSRRGDQFIVETDGPDGSLDEFVVSYTFGIEPLQQYLIEFPDGRLQALSIAWDSRTPGEGGRRWFHLYPDEEVDYADELHWTGRQQNWNFMCADCHSTNVRKGYDAAADRFRTTWSDLTVGCEACHGPASRHVDWASASWFRDRRWPDHGLAIEFDERDGVTWPIDVATGRPERSRPRESTVEIDTCAPCHSRRAQVAEGHRPGDPLLDAYRPALLEEGLYFPDGQQRDEVYTWASFRQSRMFDAGVTCSDCHDPHDGNVRADGNALCATCHAPANYDTASHHFHEASGAGGECVECHMPARTYMGVDRRRDHSIRVPRPDLAVSLGVPDACTGCHFDREPEWAAGQLREWLGRDATGYQQFADAFHADETGAADAAARLGGIAGDAGQPAIVRATALHRLADHPGPQGPALARSALSDEDPNVRRGALSALGVLPPAERVPLVAPRLNDEVRAVRTEAAWQLAPVAAALPEGPDRVAFNQATEEFIATQRLVADRPEGRATLANFFARLGRDEEAETEYRAATALDPAFVPGYVNLAELQRLEGNEPAAEATLRTALGLLPDSPDLHHALGLSLARSRRLDEALEALEQAMALAPDNPQFAYTYVVGLNSSGRVGEAIRAVEAAVERHPDDANLLFALATFHRDAGNLDEAIAAATKLRDARPGDADAAALLASLEAAREP